MLTVFLGGFRDSCISEQSEGGSPADILISHFWPPELQDSFCCFNLLSSWSFVRATPGNECRQQAVCCWASYLSSLSWLPHLLLGLVRISSDFGEAQC